MTGKRRDKKDKKVIYVPGFDPNEFGRRVAFVRELIGMTQDELAEKVGLSRASIINIENNSVTYKFNASVKFANQNKLGVAVKLVTLQENIEYIRCTFACADRWAHSFEGLKQDTLFHGIHTLVKFGLNGYIKMLKNAPFVFKQLLWIVVSALLFTFSMLPVPLDINGKKIFDKRK